MTALADLMETHRGPLEFDWRTRFHLPLTVVGESMTWGEAVRLVRILRSDPSSAFTAAVEGWDYGVSREALILLDLFDLEYAKAGVKNRKPHPMRPGKPDEKAVKHRGDRAGRTNDQVLALVRPASGESRSA